MLTKQTLEVRWFNQGQLPVNIQQWFWNDCLGQLAQTRDSPEERTDYYLYLPKCQILSFKFRQNNLEVKWRKDYFGIEQFLNTHPNQDTYNFLTTWRGKVERWLKLEYTEDSVKNTFNTNNDQNHVWIKVQKKRWQRFYKNVEFEIANLELGQTCWWTVAAEMEEDDKSSEQNFNRAIEEFSQTYSGLDFSDDKSYAYPSWLLQNFPV